LYIEENENFEFLNPCVVANKEEIKQNEDAEVKFERIKENLSYDQIIEFRNDFNDTIKSFQDMDIDLEEVIE